MFRRQPTGDAEPERSFFDKENHLSKNELAQRQDPSAFFAGVLALILLCISNPAFAEVAIETSVSRSRVAVGEELQLDLIITNAEGKISTPNISSIQGFTSYSQGRSQEIQIINGRTSSKSIFSYILIANELGQKTIGPFEINIGDKTYKVAPVKVEVVQNGGGGPSSGGPMVYSQTSVSSPNPRALPTEGVSDRDIFVKVWLDKDTGVVNEPAMLAYTLYTRLSATYRGFEKEPETTGFWIEDFPPDKTIRRTEQILNGSRYVVADVRKIALFPTQSGVYTIEPGVLSAAIEVRSQDSFDNFFSSNVFGRRSFPSTFISQIIEKKIPAEKVVLTVDALPEAGKPSSFKGAVGNYRIESSLDKQEVEAGNPVTFRLRLSGQGNISTVELPAIDKLENFKIYDSSTSTNISKNRLIVEGEKVVETVMVPKKEGDTVIPSLIFSYFDPKLHEYKQLRTVMQRLKVLPGVLEAQDNSSGGSSVSPITPAEKEDVLFLGKDIRYIKPVDDGKKLPDKELYRRGWYWVLDLVLAIMGTLFMFFSRREPDASQEAAARSRRSKQTANKKLKSAAKFLKEGKKEEFYAEISRAVHGYFSDKLGLPKSSSWISFEELEHEAATKVDAKLLEQVRQLFDRMAAGRFSTLGSDAQEMKVLYESVAQVITDFEKARIR